MNDLTAVQQRALSFLTSYVEVHGYPPSTREVADAVGLRSTASALHQLRELQRKGYIRRTPNVPRGLSITKEVTPP